MVAANLWRLRAIYAEDTTMSERQHPHLTAADTDLMGPDDRAETPAVPPGRLMSLTLRPAHDGRRLGPDLAICWGAMAAPPASADVALHLPGPAAAGAPMALVEGRTTPTLTVLLGGALPAGPDGLGALIALALERFAGAAGAERVALRRLIVTARAGDGAALMQLLAHNDPDEIYVFGALTCGALPLIKWAVARIGRERSLSTAALAERAGAMRVLYLPGARAERQSLIVDRVLATALAGAPEGLRSRYRVEAMAR
jgi:hypothetical protein